MMSFESNSRRDFLKTAAVGAAGVALSTPASSYARILGANERIAVGMIGIGRMARNHLKNLLELPGAEVVALCDVYRPNLEKAASMAPEAQTYTDFRALLDSRNVDAVVVATPDHWHALPTVRACEAGKDVYVEKPASLTITEGRRMVEAARRHDRIVQVGTQQRSAVHFQRAMRIVQSGWLGPISFVRTWNYGNEYPDGIGDPPNSEPPPGLDWDLWLGPASNVPYNHNRFGVYLDDKEAYTRWSSFRYFWDYAGGMMTDWGVHLLDIVQGAMEVVAPTSISAVGGKFYLKDNRETPDTLTATFRYPGFVCTYENRRCNGHAPGGRGYGIQFHGTEGTLFVDRGGFEITPEAGSDVLPMQAQRLDEDAHKQHMQGFLDCIKTRQQPVSDIETGHRSTSVALLGNIAYRSGRRIAWDAEREEIIGDPEASELLSADYRAPWTL